ncbi:MAG: hypothetical protein QF721_11550 [Verrucomicrobiota bacterium]|nr:hypothetical protein [Verrucomicrobiota bacterium]
MSHLIMFQPEPTFTPLNAVFKAFYLLPLKRLSAWKTTLWRSSGQVGWFSCQRLAVPS